MSSEVAWLFLVAYWIVALLVVSFFYAVWNRGLRAEAALHSVRFRPDSPREHLPEQVLRAGPMPAPIFEGDSITLDLRIVSHRGVRGPARITGAVGDVELSAATAVVPRGGWSDLRPVGPLRRGPVAATGWTVTSGDLLGFFPRRTRTGGSEVALILPPFISLSERVQVRELEASFAAPRAGTGTELFGIREYRPGDPLRRIHWRSSARHGELIVREYEPPGAQTLGILCDPHPPSIDVADQIARLAASEAWDCLQAGGRVVLWAPGCEPTRTDESRSLWAMLEWLARFPRHLGPRDEGAGEHLPSVSDAVLVTASSDPALLDAVESVKVRGGSVRAWVVGDADVLIEGPVQRAGLQWPV